MLDRWMDDICIVVVFKFTDILLTILVFLILSTNRPTIAVLHIFLYIWIVIWIIIWILDDVVKQQDDWRKAELVHA